ncbi:OLC1v1001681C1 [Oldenlandia corymbosa var. corymbosa]|uniref:OLC1v1001681C1 n=1 Tax=Oldenlandia corymbosa var. corymbosa TaxID=529605 RepID=A0AAV1D8R0_OLDCO|nr:OLC1v1001681C1 [Oldenlandia corymbosa var. corymbosa]
MRTKQETQHFSHHHALVPLEGEELNCYGCKTKIIEPFHGCISCDYFLHESCLKTPRFLRHPSHPQHSLTLIPTPTYSSRSFLCDACGCEGNSFSLSCAECDFDLDLYCAALPTALELREKHEHVVTLAFESPHSIICCDICGKNINPKSWIYYCESCDFGVHLVCAAQHKRESTKKNEKEKQKDTNVESSQRDETEEEKEDRERSGNEKQNKKAKAKDKNSKKKNGKEKKGKAAKVENFQRDDEPEEETAEDHGKSVSQEYQKMLMRDMENQLILQAMDNANDYIGYGSTKYYYY